MPRIAPADRRSALAEAALTVLRRDGIDAVTTRAVVAEAGMSLASLHYVYDSRAALLREVVELVVAGEGRMASAGSALAEADDAATEPVDPRVIVRAALGGYFEAVRRDPAREQATFEITQHALREPELADLAAAQYARYHAEAAELIATASLVHALDWAVPLHDLARLVVALTDGVTLAWLADRDDIAAERSLDLAAVAIAAHVRRVEP